MQRYLIREDSCALRVQGLRPVGQQFSLPGVVASSANAGPWSKIVCLRPVITSELEPPLLTTISTRRLKKMEPHCWGTLHLAVFVMVATLRRLALLSLP